MCRASRYMLIGNRKRHICLQTSSTTAPFSPLIVSTQRHAPRPGEFNHCVDSVSRVDMDGRLFIISKFQEFLAKHNTACGVSLCTPYASPAAAPTQAEASTISNRSAFTFFGLGITNRGRGQDLYLIVEARLLAPETVANHLQHSNGVIERSSQWFDPILVSRWSL